MGADSKVLDGLIDVGRMAWRDVKPSAVFLIDRDRPLRAEQSLERFGVLSALYRKVASRESSSYPVHVISNEDFASAQKRIENVVKQFLDKQQNCLTGIGSR